MNERNGANEKKKSMMHGKVKKHTLIFFVREPLKSYKMADRGNCLGGTLKTRRKHY